MIIEVFLIHPRPSFSEPPTRDKDFTYGWQHIFLMTVGCGLVFGILLALVVIKVCLHFRDKKIKMKAVNNLLLVPVPTRQSKAWKIQ